MTKEGPPNRKPPTPSANADDKTHQRKTEKSYFFATENPNDPIAVAGCALRAAQYASFSSYSWDTYEDGDVCGIQDSADYDREVARLCTSTGLNKFDAEAAIDAYYSLRFLPQLREMQSETHRLDIRRLRAVSDMIGELGENLSPDACALFDDELIRLFTPHRTNQQLPTQAAVTKRLRKIVADLDSSAAYNAKKRREREKKGNAIPPGHCELSFHDGVAGRGVTGMTMMADFATMASTKAFIEAAAREHNLSHADAVLKLLTGEIAPAASAVIYGYAPKTPEGAIDEAAAVFIPGFGFTDGVGTEAFHYMAEKSSTSCENGKTPGFVDLDAAAHHSVEGYVAPEKVKAFVRARDGVCIFPGCTRSAWACQLDHRVPYGEGGRTEAANLHCLCQHHHNMKTDKRAFYLADPVTGDIVWLFDDGTYALVSPEGFINSQVTPADPRWRTSVDSVQGAKRKRLQFLARGHAIMDAYDEHWDYDRCVAELQALEKENGLVFPFHPVPMPQEPEPDAPEPELVGKEDL